VSPRTNPGPARVFCGRPQRLPLRIRQRDRIRRGQRLLRRRSLRPDDLL